LNDKGDLELFQSPLLGDNLSKDVLDGSGFLPRDAFINDDYFVTAKDTYSSYWDIAQAIKFIKAGPRSEIFNNPAKTKVCIVTCGGLCPGLNVVIRELFMCLHYNYKVEEIFGIKWGYKGFYTDVE
jgi:6-phosphofructokinase 1